MRDEPCDICMLVLNDVTFDARVLKEAKSLSKAGWDVQVLSICQSLDNLPEIEKREGFLIHRIGRYTGTNVRIESAPLSTLVLWHLRRKARRYLNPNRFPLERGIWQVLPILKSVYRSLFDHREVDYVASQVQSHLPHAKIFHAHDFNALRILDKLEVYPVVYDSHELFFDRIGQRQQLSKRKEAQLRIEEKNLAQKAIATLTVGSKIADEMVANLQIAPPIVIHNAVDLEEICTNVPDISEAGMKTIVHSGSITQGRSLFQLVESLRFLPNNTRLVLLGEDRLDGKLFQFAEEIGVRNRVIHIAPVEPTCVSQTLKQADIAAVLIERNKGLSYELAYPNKFFEAVAAGLPIIVGPNEGTREFVEAYNLGIVCDQTSPKDIGHAIKQLVSDNELYEKLQSNVYHAQEQLNWQQEEKKLIDIYLKLFDTFSPH